MRSRIEEYRRGDLRHAVDLAEMVDAYARSPMGQGAPLEATVKERLARELEKRDDFFAALAYMDGVCAGVVVCFFGFSTFAARPLLNIHDIVVLPEFRRAGLARKLLEAVETKARAEGCCKVTLEVRTDNPAAISLYDSFGFEQPAMFFRTKTLP